MPLLLRPEPEPCPELLTREDSVEEAEEDPEEDSEPLPPLYDPEPELRPPEKRDPTVVRRSRMTLAASSGAWTALRPLS